MVRPRDRQPREAEPAPAGWVFRLSPAKFSRVGWRTPMIVVPDTVEIDIGPQRLKALLGVPENAEGLVIFAHGSGSGRLSPRNNRVAAALRDAGLATLLLDLLTPAEERDRANVFDIPLLASRLSLATDWSAEMPETAQLA